MAEIVSVFSALEEGKNTVYCCSCKTDFARSYRPEGIAGAIKSLAPPVDIRNEVKTEGIDEVLLRYLGNYNLLGQNDLGKIKELVDSDIAIRLEGISKLDKMLLPTYLGNAIRQVFPDANQFTEFQTAFTIKEGIEIRIYPRPKTSYRRHESYDIFFLYDNQYQNEIDKIVDKASKILGRT